MREPRSEDISLTSSVHRVHTRPGTAARSTLVPASAPQRAAVRRGCCQRCRTQPSRRRPQTNPLGGAGWATSTALCDTVAGTHNIPLPPWLQAS